MRTEPPPAAEKISRADSNIAGGSATSPFGIRRRMPARREGRVEAGEILPAAPAAHLVLTKNGNNGSKKRRRKFMRYVKVKRLVRLVVLLAVFGLALPSTPAARALDGNRAPDLPSPLCDSVEAPAGNKVSSRVYALGVQVYRWSGAGWTFVEPVANLYADRNFNGQVGTHYGGPTWESNSGSEVEARRVPGTGCTPDANAIPWLLLRAVRTEGPGIYDGVTYVQRVSTTGGLAPAAPGSFVGEEARVPYTAEYYFYRAKD
jgi:hypothetical protein